MKKAGTKKNLGSGSPVCPNCLVPYERHIGLRSTCAALQCAMNTLRQIAIVPRAGRCGRMATATVRFIESQTAPRRPDPEVRIIEIQFKKIGVNMVDVKIAPAKKHHVTRRRSRQKR